MNKEVVICPECGQKMRVPTNKHIIFSCPACKRELELGGLESNSNEDQDENIQKVDEEDTDPILKILGYIITVPIYLILHRVLPDLDWIYNLDRLALFLVTLFVVAVLLEIFNRQVYWGIGTGIVFLIFGQITDRYGFTDLFRDYRTIVFSIVREPNPANIITNKLGPFDRKNAFIDAINYREPEVRNFALKAVRKHFLYYQKEIHDYRQFIQAVAIYQEVKPKWNYVNDPNNEEYIAKSSESIQHFSGDCDDYSVVMSACLKAIGCRVKLVRTKGHIFPALYIGNHTDRINTEFILKKYLYPQIDVGKRIYYFKDSNGEIWINMDYTDIHPGGRFMSDKLLNSMEI